MAGGNTNSARDAASQLKRLAPLPIWHLPIRTLSGPSSFWSELFLVRALSDPTTLDLVTPVAFLEISDIAIKPRSSKTVAIFNAMHRATIPTAIFGEIHRCEDSVDY